MVVATEKTVRVAHDPTTTVWDRLWLHRPLTAKDDALLARERRSPRWQHVVSRLTRAYGGIKGLKTIELGCGRGDLSVLLAQHGATVTLLDQSARALDEAKYRFKRLGLIGEFVGGDMLGPLAEHADHYDVSVSLGVTEHFLGDQRRQVTAAHLNVLKPGGMAMISVPHAWCIPYRCWKFYLERRGWWPYGQEIPYSKREIKKIARRVGFAEVEAVCTGFWQSVGDHWLKRWSRNAPDWNDRISVLDQMMGLNLLLFAKREGADSAAQQSAYGLDVS